MNEISGAHVTYSDTPPILWHRDKTNCKYGVLSTDDKPGLEHTACVP